MISQQTSERHLTRVLTQAFSDVEEISPKEVQAWLGAATQSGLPAAIDSTTTKLKTSSPPDFEPEFEDLAEQLEYEPELESFLEPEVVYEDYTSPEYWDKEPLVELQDRIAYLERLLCQRTVQFTSFAFEEGYSPALLEQTTTSETVEFDPLAEGMAKYEPDEKTASESKAEPEASTFDCTATPANTSMARKLADMSRAVDDRNSFLSSSSEL